MKKLTRLLSILMLIAMCLSLMTVSASAAGIVTGDSAGSSAAEAPVVINNGGKDVFSTENYYKDSDFYSEEEPVEVANEEEEPVKGSESVLISNFNLNIQSEIDTSFPNVAENLNQILYVLNRYADGTIGKNSAEMKDLKALFGDAVDSAIEAIDIVKNASRYAERYALSKENEGSEKSHEDLVNEFLADPINIYRSNPAVFMMVTMSGTATFEKFVVNGVNYTDLDSAIKAGVSTGKQIDVYGTWAFGTGTYSINFQGCTFVPQTAGVAAFQVSSSSTYSFSNGTIKGDGFFITDAATRANIKGITITVSKTGGQSAVSVNNGTVNLENCSFVNGAPAVHIKGGTVTFNSNVSTSDGDAIRIENGTLSVTGGSIKGLTGIRMEGGTLNYNSAGNVTGTGTPSGTDAGNGAAIASYNNQAFINISSAPKNSISSAKTGAITCYAGGSRCYTKGAYNGGKIHIADKTSLVNYDKDGLYSDFAGAVAAIGDATYATLADALNAASNGDTVRLLADTTIANTLLVEKDVIIDGNGYTVTSNATPTAIEIKSGSAQIKNFELNCNAKEANGVQVDNGAKLEVNGLSIANCNYAGIYSLNGGKITVSNYINTSTTTNASGFACDNGGSILIHGCTIDCPNPLNNNYNNGISIDGGSFKFDSTTDSTKKNLVDNHIIKGASAAQEGSYYVVTQDAASISLISGYDSSADPAYFWYFKGLDDNAAMQFKSENAVEPNQATVIGVDGTTKTVTIYLSGDTYTIEPDSVKALPAGSYTLRIPFAKGNYCDVGLKVYAGAQVHCYDKNGNEIFQDKEKTIPLYDVTQDKAGKLTFTDKPVKVGITYNPADTDTIVWLDDIYFNSDNSFTLMQDDLNKLPAGLNYVVLKYDDDCIFGAKIYVKNVNASINPEKVKWSTLYGDIVYTVVPDIKSVKFDGIELEKDNQYFINKSGKLVLKANFLKNYIAHDKDGNTVSSEHTLLVETSKGNVLSNITIGEQLKNNGVNYHIYGGTATLSFVGSNPIDYSKGIWIGAKNPVQIPDDYITQTSGTTFTIKADYLNKLTYGTYTIGAYINGEYCTTTFVICTKEAATAAATGDTFNAWIWIAILVLVAVIFFVILLPKLKGKKNIETVETEKDIPEEDTNGKE